MGIGRILSTAPIAVAMHGVATAGSSSTPSAAVTGADHGRGARGARADRGRFRHSQH